ncbi:MAG: phosphatidylserine decarboxylase [Planctomycetes bacterium]|nr:phosphatidylserine decarboxylase [Planctomycetota bacterium]
MKIPLRRTKLEEIRQASNIHGGVLNLCLAALGVKLARVQIPSKKLRLRLYRTIYGKKYAALNESELDRPLADYPSLNALFTRGVRPECRPIPEAANQILCPCDGKVQEVGRVRQDCILTVKGVEYTIRSLLPHVDTRLFEGGPFGIFFLSPSDCHRVFSPQDGWIEEVIHIPGYRLLVHPPYQRKEYPVFALNERIILRLSTRFGACVLVLVAGWGVGHITLPVDRTFRPRRWGLKRKKYLPALRVKRGEWLGTFELGSTVLLITEPTGRMIPLVAPEDKVRYGQPVFAPLRGLDS